jgi:hypothetical protein
MSAMSIDVFIAWSGLRSRRLASTLRDWLPQVFPGIHAWMSDTDVPAGEQWLDIIIEECKSARAMIVCLTPENQDSRWLHFEAGLSVGKLVLPLLQDLDPGDVQAPIGYWNCCIADARGVQKLLRGWRKTTVSDFLLARLISAYASISFPIMSSMPSGQ